MNARIIWTAVGIWSAIAILAIANGALRQAVLVPVLGDSAAQVVSVVILAIMIGLIQWWMVRGRWAHLSRRWLATIGAAWMAATILFEFTLGRLVLEMSWSSLFQQYNVAAGKLWPVIPLLLLLGMPLMKAKEGTA